MADMAADDEREEELSSITAIFPELALDPASPFTAAIDLPVAPSVPLAVVFLPSVDGVPPASLPTPPTSDTEGHKTVAGAPQAASRDVHSLSYLPPLRLRITLPEGYPAEKAPQFELSTSPGWMPATTLQKLVDEGFALWEEYGHGQVVFAYIDFLQQAAETCFDLVGDEAAVLEVPDEMKISLLNYDIKAKRDKFERETFDCGVCLEPKKGSACHRLVRCGHVFCVACLQDFYNNCITEGDVANVKCLAPDCGRESNRAARSKRKKTSERTLNPSELLQIPIEKPMVQRYVELKRKKKLESDKSTVYCPRKWCQGPARSKKYPKVTDLSQIVDSDTEDEDENPPVPRDRVEEQVRGSQSSDRLAVCENCEYAFCRVCLAGWHGEFIRCFPRDSTELSAEEQASYDYLRLHTLAMPDLLQPCQKTHGCNHMSCFQCRTHFCYLCGAWLDPSNPYEHFNNRETGCYMRLWELEEGDEGDGNVRFEGPRGWEAAVAAANEADAREAQNAENAGAAAAINAAPPANQNPQAAIPLAPMPPRADIDPPLIVAMNALLLDPNVPVEPGIIEQAARNIVAAQARAAAAAQRPPQQAQRQRNQAQRQRNQQQRQPNQAPRRAPPAVQQNNNDRNAHQRPAGGQGADPGPGRWAQRGGNAPGYQGNENGLARFLEMVRADEEDGWDSDELDEEGDEGWEIPER